MKSLEAEYPCIYLDYDIEEVSLYKLYGYPTNFKLGVAKNDQLFTLAVV